MKKSQQNIVPFPSIIHAPGEDSADEVIQMLYTVIACILLTMNIILLSILLRSSAL